MKKTTTFGQRLRSFRLRAGLSVSQVARRLGVAESTYREWEYGRQIRGEPYRKLADILGVSLSILLSEEGEAHPQTLIEDLNQLERLVHKIRTML